MGTLRKMGAFLGLVPDEADQHSGRADRGRYSDDYDSADRDGRYDAEYDGYARDDYSTDRHDGYSANGYAHDDYARGGYSTDEYQGYSDEHDDADSARELVPAGQSGRYGESVDRTAADEHSAYSPYRESGRTADVRRETQPTSLGGRRGRTSGRTDEVDYDTQGALAIQPQTAPSVDAADGAGKPATVSLTGFADAREVGELFRTGQAVILDMTELTDAEARRMVDFAAGLAFAVRGSIDKVTTKVFMLHQPSADGAR